MYQGMRRPIDVDLAAGTARLVGATIGDHISYRSGSPSATHVVVYGTDGNDRIRGRNYPELLFGFGGNDVLAGCGRDDSLDGGKGDDLLDGGDGDDWADGGKGSDSCTNAEDVVHCSP